MTCNKILSLLVFVLFLTNTGAVAQRKTQAKVAPGGNVPIYAIGDNFLGTWEWHSGNDMFRLRFSRNDTYVLANGQTASVVIGQHLYSRNGTVIESSFAAHSNIPDGWSLLGRPHADWNLAMSFVDVTKNKLGAAKLSISSAFPNQLHFMLQEVEAGRVASAVTPGFTVPANVVLTRVP